MNALDGNPGLFEAANALGEIFAIKNSRFKSLEYYNISLKINNEQSEIHYRVSELYDSIVKFDLALRHSLTAVKLDPRHLKANLLLGRYAYLQGKGEEARKYYSASTEEGLKKCGALLSEIRTKDPGLEKQKIISLYLSVLSDCPSLVDAYESLYELQRSRKDYSGAAETMERLIAVRPDYEHAYINLGGLYFDERLPGNRKFYIDKAIRYLKKAIEINPSNAESHYNLARIYFRLGSRNLAREHEAKALKIEKGP